MQSLCLTWLFRADFKNSQYVVNLGSQQVRTQKVLVKLSIDDSLLSANVLIGIPAPFLNRWSSYA